MNEPLDSQQRAIIAELMLLMTSKDLDCVVLVAGSVTPEDGTEPGIEVGMVSNTGSDMMLFLSTYLQDAARRRSGDGGPSILTNN